MFKKYILAINLIIIKFLKFMFILFNFQVHLIHIYVFFIHHICILDPVFYISLFLHDFSFSFGLLSSFFSSLFFNIFYHLILSQFLFVKEQINHLMNIKDIFNFKIDYLATFERISFESFTRVHCLLNILLLLSSL